MADSDHEHALCQHGNPRHACAEMKCPCRRFTDRRGPASKIAQPAHD